MHGKFQTQLPTRCTIAKHEQEVQNFSANKLRCKKQHTKSLNLHQKNMLCRIVHKKFESPSHKCYVLEKNAWEI
jgi:hypothetical protein